MNLAQLQSALFSLVTADGATRVQPAQLVDAGKLSPEQRVDVYAQMYVLRTQDAIREDFPKVSARLGDRFEATVHAYVQRHPSTHYSLSMLGQHFAGFLRERPEDAQLADLAQLEWLHSDSFIARDSQVLTTLSGVDPTQFGTAKLEFVPAFRLAWLAHDVRPLWREEAQTAPVAKTAFVVWRKEHEVFHVVVEADEARAIEALLRGETLEAACEAFTEREDPAAAAFAAIGSWLSEGMLARVVTQPLL
jgi:hypothetical protein